MELLLDRSRSSDICTISPLTIKDDFECYILEDVVREIPGVDVAKWKIYGKTAIPAGRYKIVLTMSNRFRRVLPLLVGVEGFEGVRIHPGNTDANTEGCLLPGERIASHGEAIEQSRSAFERLFDKLKAAAAAGEENWITIVNAATL